MCARARGLREHSFTEFLTFGLMFAVIVDVVVVAAAATLKELSGH